jgi:hypothetical protein
VIDKDVGTRSRVAIYRAYRIDESGRSVGLASCSKLPTMSPHSRGPAPCLVITGINSSFGKDFVGLSQRLSPATNPRCLF